MNIQSIGQNGRIRSKRSTNLFALILFSSFFFMKESQAQCVPTAPCATCTGATTTCTSCVGGWYFVSGTNTCVVPGTCPITTYSKAATNSCESCIQGCDYCTDDFTCTSCNSGAGYRLSSGNRCTKCTSPCETCYPSNLSQCTTCEGSRYLLGNVCLTSCPTGYYASFDKECFPCMTGCSVCSNGYECTTCNTGLGYSPYNYKGLDICILSTTCLFPCSTCSTALAPETCATCVTNYVMQGSSCWWNCNSAYYKDVNRICQPCSSNCKTCVEQPTTCLSCNAPLSLQNSTCVQSCPFGTISVSNVCTPGRYILNTTQRSSFSRLVFNMFTTFITTGILVW